MVEEHHFFCQSLHHRWFASPLIFIKIILTFFRYYIICIFLDRSLMISHVLHVRKHIREDCIGIRRSIDFRCLFLYYSTAHSIGALMTISKLYFNSKKNYKSFAKQWKSSYFSLNDFEIINDIPSKVVGVFDEDMFSLL